MCGRGLEGMQVCICNIEKMRLEGGPGCIYIYIRGENGFPSGIGEKITHFGEVSFSIQPNMLGKVGEDEAVREREK